MPYVHRLHCDYVIFSFLLTIDFDVCRPELFSVPRRLEGMAALELGHSIAAAHQSRLLFGLDIGLSPSSPSSTPSSFANIGGEGLTPEACTYSVYLTALSALISQSSRPRAGSGAITTRRLIAMHTHGLTPSQAEATERTTSDPIPMEMSDVDIRAPVRHRPSLSANATVADEIERKLSGIAEMPSRDGWGSTPRSDIRRERSFSLTDLHTSFPDSPRPIHRGEVAPSLSFKKNMLKVNCTNDKGLTDDGESVATEMGALLVSPKPSEEPTIFSFDSGSPTTSQVTSRITLPASPQEGSVSVITRSERDPDGRKSDPGTRISGKKLRLVLTERAGDAVSTSAVTRGAFTPSPGQYPRPATGERSRPVSWSVASMSGGGRNRRSNSLPGKGVMALDFKQMIADVREESLAATKAGLEVSLSTTWRMFDFVVSLIFSNFFLQCSCVSMFWT